MLRGVLGDEFGGAWLAADGRTFNVGVTTKAAAQRVRAAGATPKLVDYAAAELTGFKAALDGATTKADADVDELVRRPQERTRSPSSRSRVRRPTPRPSRRRTTCRTRRSASSPRASRRGCSSTSAAATRTSSTGSSAARSASPSTGGFVTAGHCGAVGATTTGFNQAPQGTVARLDLPRQRRLRFRRDQRRLGRRPVVNDFNGGEAPVAGSEEAPVGAAVCRSGSTTGTRCGVIQAKNATVNYPEGAVTGLTQTDVCAEGGDSGGSWLSGDQAQGVTSGGSGDCTVGGTTFFQPVNEILAGGERRAGHADPGTGEPPATEPPATEPPATEPPGRAGGVRRARGERQGVPRRHRRPPGAARRRLLPRRAGHARRVRVRARGCRLRRDAPAVVRHPLAHGRAQRGLGRADVRRRHRVLPVRGLVRAGLRRLPARGWTCPDGRAGTDLSRRPCRYEERVGAHPSGRRPALRVWGPRSRNPLSGLRGVARMGGLSDQGRRSWRTCRRWKRWPTASSSPPGRTCRGRSSWTAPTSPSWTPATSVTRTWCWRPSQHVSGRKNAQLAAVVLTHAHVDHLGAASRLHASRGVPVLAHEPEAAHVRGEVIEQVTPLQIAARVWRPRIAAGRCTSSPRARRRRRSGWRTR